MTPSHLLRRLPRLLLLAVLFAGSGMARGADDAGELKLVIILTRHGVRSPLQANEVLGKYAAEPWPAWNVPLGILTPHGREEMRLMGGYYRERYVAAGFLAEAPAANAGKIYCHADNDQRTQESALALAEGLLPGAPPPLHGLPAGRIDPLYRRVQVSPELPDRARAIAALSGRIGDNPAAYLANLQPEFTLLQQVLCGPAGEPPPGKLSVARLPAQVQAGSRDHTVGFEGPLHAAEQIVDALELAYAEGRPMAEVGWGRLTPAQLTQLLRLHALYFDLTQGTFYPAQVQGSGLAHRYRATLEQAVTGRAVPDAFGQPGQSFVVVNGHDTNIANLGGLLGLHWELAGAPNNPVLPGGGLVLELRRRPASGRWFVRFVYIAQTLDQIRSLAPLGLRNPPGIAPIYIPGISEAGPGYDAPLAQFEALLQRVIDPRFVPATQP